MFRLNFRQIISILEKNHFTLTRVRGSHGTYMGIVNGQRRIFTVQQNHLNETVAIGTLKSIIRQSGLAKELFKP